MAQEQHNHFDILIGNTGIQGGAGRPCNEKDTLRWQNESDYQITSFSLPGCVGAQPSPGFIAVGDQTPIYAVQEGAKVPGQVTSYPYSWLLQDGTLIIVNTQSGTIDVS
jgi:hypothetical protein